jgi:rod shape-determining protein MreD
MQVNDRNRDRRSIGVLAVISLLCQLGIAPAIALGNGHPDFAFVFVAVVAFTIGGETGVLAAFFAGLVFDLSSTGPIGLMALLFPIAAYALGIEVRDRIAEEPVMTIIPFVIAAFCVAVCYNIAMLLYGVTDSFFDALVFRALPTTFLTFIAYLPFLFILGRAHGGIRVGGSSGKHRSRYTLGNR